jgi:hypothetical protein
MIELTNKETGETLSIEPDEDGRVYIPKGDWAATWTVVIPDGVEVRAVRAKDDD